MHKIRWTMILLMTLRGLSGCEDETEQEAPSCALCVPDTTICQGEFSVQCNGDGSEIEVTSCLDGQYCDESTGLCVLSQCPSIDYRRCADDETLSVCRRGQLESESCDPGQLCKSGTCVSVDFSGTVCGYRSVLTGTGSDIAVTECANGETCSVINEAGDLGCMPMICTPGSRICGEKADDSGPFLAQVCNMDGTGGDLAQEEDCSQLFNSCVDGFCSCAAPILVNQVQSAAEDRLDVVGGGQSTQGNPENISVQFEERQDEEAERAGAQSLKKPDVVEALVDGDRVVFNSSGDVEFSEATSRLSITFSSGVRKMELLIGEADPLWTGVVSEKSDGFIGYNDGSGDPGENFTWGAGLSPMGTNYEGTLVIAVDENEGPGGRVTGSFSGALNAAPGSTFEPVSVTDGVFDIFYDGKMIRPVDGQ